jgi:predicted protein tyrosine phosphatase
VNVPVRFHILGRKEARQAVDRVFGDPSRRILSPSAVVSISSEEPAPSQLRDLRVPILTLQMPDVTRDMPTHGYFAPTREHVEALLAFATEYVREGDVIVHCAAGISRSSACTLALLAQYGVPKHDGLSRGNRMRDAARLCVLDLLASVHDTHAAGLRDDVGIRPNPRIVWHADQILGWRGHLLAAVEDVFAMRGLWVDLGEEPPAGWPGRPA